MGKSELWIDEKKWWGEQERSGEVNK